MIKKKIMQIEDDDFNIRLMKKVIDNFKPPADLIVAQDGKKALEYLSDLKKNNNLPNIIILDLKLPYINGFELLKQIRSKKETKIIPVIILTSSENQEDINTGYELGANSYVLKPVLFEDFEKEVTLILRYWITSNLCPEVYS